MGRVKGAAVLAIGSGLCLAPSFVPISSSSVRAGGAVGPVPQTSFMPSGPCSPGAGTGALALVGTAALMAVRSTRTVRKAEPEEKAKAEPEAPKESAKETKESPKEAKETKADKASTSSAESAEAKAAAPAEETTPVGFDLTKQIGVTPPLGFWDPAKLCKGEDDFKKFRIAELKHGRVAMMAALGAVFQHYISFPGFDEVPRGMEALSDGTGIFGFLLLFAASGYLELEVWSQKAGQEPGDFGDPLGLAGKMGKYDDEWRNRELNNGRFAMFAAMGIIIAENETGLDAVEQIIGI
eukprot:Skav211646  [mRNA]  locus=scaffold1290:210945:220203:- [translate_table: standard]